MSDPLEKVKKNHLWSLIRRVGTYYDEDLEFVREYAREIYEAGNVDEAIQCFSDLVCQLKEEKRDAKQAGFG